MKQDKQENNDEEFVEELMTLALTCDTPFKSIEDLIKAGFIRCPNVDDNGNVIIPSQYVKYNKELSRERSL